MMVYISLDNKNLRNSNIYILLNSPNNMIDENKTVLMYIPYDAWRRTYKIGIEELGNIDVIALESIIVCDNGETLTEAVNETKQSIDKADLVYISEMPGLPNRGIALADKIRNELGYKGPMVYLWFDPAPKDKQNLFNTHLEPPIKSDTFKKVAREYLNLVKK
jgi:hypothetical protein